MALPKPCAAVGGPAQTAFPMQRGRISHDNPQSQHQTPAAPADKPWAKASAQCRAYSGAGCRAPSTLRSVPMGRAEENQKAAGKAADPGMGPTWQLPNKKMDPGAQQNPADASRSGTRQFSSPVLGCPKHLVGSPMCPHPQDRLSSPTSVGALRSLTAARQERGTLPGKADYSPCLELIRACLN